MRSRGAQGCSDIGRFQHVKQVLDDVLAADEVDALQALIGQVACVAGLPKGHQQCRRTQHLFQSRCHLHTVDEPVNYTISAT